MKIVYYLDLDEGKKKKKNLYCRISDGTEQVTFSMGYEVDPKKWDSHIGELDWEDVHHETLEYFRDYLIEKYEELKNEGKAEALAQLKNEALLLTQESGIDGIAEKMFDYNYKEQDLPKYKDFIQAFEKFSKLKKGAYKVEIVDNEMRFHTNDKKVYEADTYEGLTFRLKTAIKSRCYEEIIMVTNNSIWNEIYIDEGIEKHKFLPVMLKEWRIFWDQELRFDSKKAGANEEMEENGETEENEENEELENFWQAGQIENLKKLKQESWENLQLFMACYDDTGDIIQLAFDIDDTGLYPIAVITMLNIFAPEVCYTEYCELEFTEENGWESIFFDEEDEEMGEEEDSPMIFFRELIITN